MIRVGFFLGTYEDWGGASRALLNFVRGINRTRFAPVVVVTKEGKLSRELTKLGIECTVWPKYELSRNLLADGYHVIRSIKLLREYRLDIVHVNYASIEWKSPVVLAAKLWRTPIVYHYHSEVRSPSPFVGFSSAVIVVSDYIKARAESLGRPTYTIHNIVDISRFAAGGDIRGKLGVPPDCTIVTFIGQVKIIKGVMTLLRAIERIENPNVRFVIAGEFREQSEAFSRKVFEDAVRADPRVMYVGYRNDVQDLYMTSDIIVMPSLYDEPCAMVLFEAAAAKKPVVASSTGGTPEIIRHGVNGMLFERDDDSALAKRITELISSQTLRKEMGERAFNMALDNFSKHPVEKLEALYKSLIPVTLDGWK